MPEMDLTEPNMDRKQIYFMEAERMKIIKIDGCIQCPFKVWAGAKRFLGMGYKEKYLCNKTLVGIDAKYFVKIDGVAEIPIWCPLEEYVKIE